MHTEIILRGQLISQDEHGFLCLNDIWRLSGENDSKSPSFWRKLPTVKELTEALISNRRFSPIWEKTPGKSASYAKRGNQGGTYAHIILALAYAEYLNPELGVEVREIALRVYAGDVTVLDEFNRTRRVQIEDDANRVMAREEIRRNNHDLNAILKSVGARFSAQWAAFHNSGYEGLYNGLTENDIHAIKKLKANQAILDHMGFYELAANMYRTALAQQYLTLHQVESVLRACHIHKRMGQRVRADHEELGLNMPEDMPVVPSIKEAQKRLKGLEKEKGKGT